MFYFFNPRFSNKDRNLTVPGGITVLSHGAHKANHLYSSTCHSRIPVFELHGLDYLLRLSILPGLAIGIDAFPSKSDLCHAADGRYARQMLEILSPVVRKKELRRMDRL